MADRYVWTSGDGSTVIDLTDTSAGYSVLANGTTGLHSVPYQVSRASYAGQDGSTITAVRAAENTPTLGMLLEATSEAAFIDKSRALVRAMRPRAAGVIQPGTLTVTRTGREPRSLPCYVTEGLEGDESVSATLPGTWWKFQLKLLAPDPWWRGPTRTIDAGLSVPTAFFPIFPLSLAASTIQGRFVVDLSDADGPSYPLWTVTGPGDALTLTNNTTGRTIQINASLTSDQTIVIDTRPGFQSVRRGDGTNLMGSLQSDPALWPLVEGINDVTALLTNAGAASRISGSYEARYAGI